MKTIAALMTFCIASLAHAQVYDGPASHRPRPRFSSPVRVHQAPAPDFGALVAAVQREAFSGDKLSVIRLASGGWFTVEQVGQLVDQLAFSDDKLAVVAMLRPRLIDAHNGYALLRHFTFSSDKERVMALLAG